MNKITIIEDDHALLEMYKLKFEFAKFNVSTATNGKEGLEVIEREQPDIVLLDIMMPIMTGDEMLAQLRREPWGKDTVVIVFTNISSEETPASLRNLDVNSYINKASCTPQMVLEKVLTVLKNRSA